MKMPPRTTPSAAKPLPAWSEPAALSLSVELGLEPDEVVEPSEPPEEVDELLLSPALLLPTRAERALSLVKLAETEVAFVHSLGASWEPLTKLTAEH